MARYLAYFDRIAAGIAHCIEFGDHRSKVFFYHFRRYLGLTEDRTDNLHHCIGSAGKFLNLNKAANKNNHNHYWIYLR